MGTLRKSSWRKYSVVRNTPFVNYKSLLIWNEMTPYKGKPNGMQEPVHLGRYLLTNLTEALTAVSLIPGSTFFPYTQAPTARCCGECGKSFSRRPRESLPPSDPTSIYCFYHETEILRPPDLNTSLCSLNIWNIIPVPRPAWFSRVFMTLFLEVH